MKRFTLNVPVLLIIMLLVLTSCNISSPPQILSTEPPSIAEPASIAVDDTATSVPPTDVPSSTSTAIPPTETPEPTLTPVPPTETPGPTLTPISPTETPFLGFPSQTARSFTSSIKVYLPNLSGSFNVQAGTSLTISDGGNDRKANTCTISRPGTAPVRIPVPISGSSNSFTLNRGTYKLNCGIPNSNATINSE